MVTMKKGTTKRASMLQTKERRLEFLELLKQGVTYRDIATRYGVDHAYVIRQSRKALEELADKYSGTADQMRAINNERLLALLSTWYPLAMERDNKATEHVLRIINDLNRLNGCLPDRPMLTNIIQNNGVGPADIVFQIDTGEGSEDAIPVDSHVVD